MLDDREVAWDELDVALPEGWVASRRSGTSPNACGSSAPCSAGASPGVSLRGRRSARARRTHFARSRSSFAWDRS